MPVSLIEEVGFHQVQMSIQIVVTRSHAHPAHLMAIGAECDPSNKGLFPESPIMVIHQQ